MDARPESLSTTLDDEARAPQAQKHLMLCVIMRASIAPISLVTGQINLLTVMMWHALMLYALLLCLHSFGGRGRDNL